MPSQPTMRFLLTLLLLAVLPAAAEVTSRGPFHVTHAARDAALAEQTLDILEEAVADFSPHLPFDDDPVHLLIADTPERFRAAAGPLGRGDVSGVAMASKGRIVVKAPYLRTDDRDFRGTVRHELAHILLHRNADTAQLPRWLNEGICMSLANEHRWASTFRVARMYLGGRVIPYYELDYAFLAPGGEMAFGDAYAQALSLTRFARKKLGEEAFWQVVQGTKTMSYGEALRKSGGMTPGELWHAYHRSLWLIALVGTLASGSFFPAIALLSLVTYYRKRRKNRAILKQWEAEEGADEDDVFHWDDVVEDPDAWKGDPRKQE